MADYDESKVSPRPETDPIRICIYRAKSTWEEDGLINDYAEVATARLATLTTDNATLRKLVERLVDVLHSFHEVATHPTYSVTSGMIHKAESLITEGREALK